MADNLRQFWVVKVVQEPKADSHLSLRDNVQKIVAEVLGEGVKVISATLRPSEGRAIILVKFDGEDLVITTQNPTEFHKPGHF